MFEWRGIVLGDQIVPKEVQAKIEAGKREHLDAIHFCGLTQCHLLREHRLHHLPKACEAHNPLHGLKQ
jgi:hypothetical protein